MAPVAGSGDGEHGCGGCAGGPEPGGAGGAVRGWGGAQLLHTVRRGDDKRDGPSVEERVESEGRGVREHGRAGVQDRRGGVRLPWRAVRVQVLRAGRGLLGLFSPAGEWVEGICAGGEQL